jgi:hypothetical protein
MLRYFQFAAVLQVGGEPRRAEGMITNLCLDAGGFRPPLSTLFNTVAETVSTF